MKIVLNGGGFLSKGVAFSGEDLSTNDDGKTIFLAIMKWHVKEDMLSLNIGELNFAKKHREKKPTSSTSFLPNSPDVIVHQRWQKFTIVWEYLTN